MKRAYVLLGGLFSTDGIATSAGMFSLVNQLKALPDTTAKWYLWGNYRQCARDIERESSATDKVALIGYSGGGWRATTVANMVPEHQDINLMVLYDPSPSWNMVPIGANVKRAVCYYNRSQMFVPFVGWIGGGKLVGHGVETIIINQQHLAVQFDQALHKRTVDMVRAL